MGGFLDSRKKKKKEASFGSFMQQPVPSQFLVPVLCVFESVFHRYDTLVNRASRSCEVGVSDLVALVSCHQSAHSLPFECRHIESVHVKSRKYGSQEFGGGL